ncbi:adenylyltransferase/cytidyltransferase family protein [uncultured Endozoicomonas sp.]|uniref:adenylyltransferase/cytidyltransferase family protein n=1 Tax=uncultured Endozoicomonas sp. TaxID=432652 RepID=UPI0026367569|nr:adenylyltransferase/cytidyltransferase family protein [uncultured Endozoicomonas sp.]
MRRLKLGVFGSAFDPPTLGHGDVIAQAAQFHDHILLVPSASHAFDKKPLPFDTRLAMLNAFIADISVDCSLTVSAIEADMLAAHPDKPVYTYDLLSTLETHYQGTANISFIRGPDNADTQTWSRFFKHREIEEQWRIFTASERLNVRSSQVRKLLKSNTGSQTDQHAMSMLTPSVKSFIIDHHLYQSGNP